MLNVSRILARSTDGKDVWMTKAQAEALDTLTQLRKGGCGALHGYVPTSGYIESPVVNIQMITRFSTEKLYARKREAIQQLSFADIQADALKDEKLNKLSLVDLNAQFETCKAKFIESIEKTEAGDRSDAHRQGHDRCYAQFGDGIKVHLVTEKVDGLMEPVLLDGYPVVDSIMISYLELNRKVIKEGVRKVVNSGPKVLMDKLIEKQLNSRSVGYKTVSLKDNNFEKLVIDSTEFVAENVSPNVLELLQD